MMLLKSINDCGSFINAVSHCRGDVMLRSTDGKEEYDLKSVVFKYIAIDKLCKDHGDMYEVFCMNLSDEGYLISFLDN